MRNLFTLLLLAGFLAGCDSPAPKETSPEDVSAAGDQPVELVPAGEVEAEKASAAKSIEPAGKVGPNEVQNAGWKALKRASFYLEHPANYIPDESGTMGTTLVLMEENEGADDYIQENIGLLVQDMTPYTITLDEYADQAEAMVPTLLQNGQVLESKRIQLNGNTMHQLVYTGVQSGIEVKAKQLCRVEGSKVLVLTYTGGVDAYDEKIQIADRVMESFEVDMRSI